LSAASIAFVVADRATKRLVMELLEDDLAAFGRVENGAVVDDVTDGAGRDVRWNDAWPSPRLAVLVLLASAA